MAHADGVFDFVIAGGGTAGCVLANRLTADRSTRVLLLEAGPSDRNLLIHLPIGFARLTSGPYDWGLRTVPQKACNDRVVPIAQGRVIGGGGSINAMVYTRGTPDDYDGWATTYGCTGWSFAEIQKYFIRMEDNERLSAPWHGNGGPLGISDIPDPHPLSKAFVMAAQQFGLPYNGDFNGPTQHGTGIYQTTTRNGRRCSAATGYLRPAMKRRNLVVKTKVTVSRVILEGSRAVAVEAVEDGELRRYRAEREVILSGGAFGSAKLLQLSGIGDPADLGSVGVAVQHGLPGVGKNLHDHCDLDIIYELKKYQSMDRLARIRPATVSAALEYALYRNGPLASTLVEGGAFSFGNADEPTPDLQFHFLPAAGVEAGIAAVRTGYGCTLNSYFLRPRSRGTVRIASADPTKAPLIDPNFVADDYDLEMTAEGLRQSREIMAQPAMAKLIRREHLAGGGQLRTKDDYFAFARAYGRTAYHPVGTCAMGVSDAAVVSPELKVHGLDALRVVDASIMPRLTSSNTQAATVMIAEKASDMILGIG